MTFDSSTLHILTDEFQKSLIGQTIRHVQQIDPHTITIKISSLSKGNHFLLISSHATHARTHLIDRPPKSQKQSHFAEIIISHLARGTITKIKQIGWDRILKITVQPFEDLLEETPKSIIAEFMGKHSNIILIDDATDRIISCIKHVDETMSRFREVLPGEPYELPPQQDRLDPFQITEDQFRELFSENFNWRDLMKKIDGLSPILAKEIIFQSNSEIDKMWLTFVKMRSALDPKTVKPQLIVDADDHRKIYAVSTFPLSQFENSKSIKFETINSALDHAYQITAETETIRSQKQSLKQIITKRKKSIDRKITSLRRDLENSENAEQFRIRGELLTANLHAIKNRSSEIEVQNYYSENLEKITIELSADLTPSENAQRYFKNYTKAKRGKTILAQLIADNEAELEVLDHHTIEFETAKTIENLEKIRSKLIEKGWIRDKQKRKKQNRSDGAFRKFTSPDGFQIYVGRNSAENDLLLRRVAKGHDMWLHAKQIHGSHVVIRNPEKKPGIPMPTLLQAAKIAAFFSQAKHSSYVPIDYTWAKYVVKRRGIGFVHYTHQKTLNVEPSLPRGNSERIEN